MTACVLFILVGLFRCHAAYAPRGSNDNSRKNPWLLAALASFILASPLSAIQAVESSARPSNKGALRVLADIMREPEAFTGKQVVFLCRYAGPSRLYKPAKTRLNQEEYVNFAAWPLEAELWTEAGRQNSLPSLYVAKKNQRLNDILRGLKKYDLVAVSGRVVSPYSGLPWIIATTVEPVPGDGGALDETTVLLMNAGLRALDAGDGATALRNFEHALVGLPNEFSSAIQQYLARAHILTGDNARARECLYRALDTGRDDPDLRLAIADLSLKLADPHTVLVECATPMPRAEQQNAAMGMTAEAKALLGDIETAFVLLGTAESLPGLTPRDKAMLDVHRARIYARCGRMGDAATLYADLCLSGAALANEPWLLRERNAFHANSAVPNKQPVAASVPGIAEPIVFGSSETAADRRGSKAAALSIDSSELVVLAGANLLNDLVYQRDGAGIAVNHAGVNPPHATAISATGEASPRNLLIPAFAQWQPSYESRHQPTTETKPAGHEAPVAPLVSYDAGDYGPGSEVDWELQPALLLSGPNMGRYVGAPGHAPSGGEPPYRETAGEGEVISYTVPFSGRDGGDAKGFVAYAAFTPRGGGDTIAPILDSAGTASFSFEPDRSPTIIAGYGSDSETVVGMPVRNPNLYKKVREANRRPAEVSSRKPAPETDIYLMTGGGGRIRQTRVLLPSTPQGIGQDHELTPLR